MRVMIKDDDDDDDDWDDDVFLWVVIWSWFAVVAKWCVVVDGWVGR